MQVTYNNTTDQLTTSERSNSARSDSTNAGEVHKSWDKNDWGKKGDWAEWGKKGDWAEWGKKEDLGKKEDGCSTDRRKSTSGSTDRCNAEDVDTLSRAQAHRGSPLRLLCLHGGGGDGEGFDRQLSMFKAELGPLVEFVCVTAPNHSDTVADRGKAGFLWMGDAQKQGPHAANWWQEESLPFLESVIAQQGPFDGVLGYSMGSAAAFALLVAVPESTFRFAVLCCGYVPSNDSLTMRQLEAQRPLRIPALHCQGLTDFVIPNEFSDAMVDYFDADAAEIVRHPGGHDVPRDAAHIAQFASFLLKFARSSQ